MDDLKMSMVRILNLVNDNIIIGFQTPVEASETGEPSEADDYMVIHYPYKVLVEQTQRSNMVKVGREFIPGDGSEELQNQHFSISLVRWIPCIQDHALLVRKQHIVCIAQPDEDVLSCYNDLIEGEFLMATDDDTETPN